MKSITKFIDYETVTGEIKTLRPCSVMDSQRLIARYQNLTGIMSQEKNNKITFQELYQDNKEFRYSCNEALKLGGIDPNDCSLDMVVMFLFPHPDLDGVLNDMGFLFSFNFPDKLKPKNVPIKSVCSDLETLIAAYSIDNMGDLVKAVNILETFTPEDLASIIKAKTHLLKPEEEKAREAGFNDALELIKRKNNGTTDYS